MFILSLYNSLFLPSMMCKVDNLKWIKARIKAEVKERLTDGISPKKKACKPKNATKRKPTKNDT